MDGKNSLKKYNYLTNPQSFRASLQEVVHAMYWAFLQANTSMHKIHLECSQVKGHLAQGLKILFQVYLLYPHNRFTFR